MRRNMLKQSSGESGSSLIEVLVTMVILAFGLLGLAGMQAKIHLLELESFERGQAVVLLNDMVERITSNRANAQRFVAAYGFANISSPRPLGTGSSCNQATIVSSLTGQMTSAAATIVARELCEWNDLIKGATEKTAGNPIGAMNAARGCISTFTVVPSVTEPAVYGQCSTGVQVDVVWLGTSATVANPGVTCGIGSYGAKDAYRRVLSTRIVTGITPC